MSRASIARILTDHARVVRQPQKRPRSTYVRIAADQPNECWQSDFIHYRLADGTDIEVMAVAVGAVAHSFLARSSQSRSVR